MQPRPVPLGLSQASVTTTFQGCCSALGATARPCRAATPTDPRSRRRYLDGEEADEEADRASPAAAPAGARPRTAFARPVRRDGQIECRPPAGLGHVLLF